MEPVKSVSLYHRLPNGRYEYCVSQGIYIKGTKFVLRLYEAGHRRWEPLPEGIDYASAKRMALEKGAALQGSPIAASHQPTVKAASVPGKTRLRDVVDSYINKLYADDNLVRKTIQGKQFELKRWLSLCPKTHFEELTREDLIAFRNYLKAEDYEKWTINSNLMSIVTCLKQSPLTKAAYKPLLETKDWMEIPDSEPDPYSLEEVLALQAMATAFVRLLIRFFVSTGCRDMEVAHVEWSDINWIQKTVRIQAKPKWNWKPKTKAGTRTIPVPDGLLADLKILKATSTNSLIFPAARGGVEYHFLRIIQELAEKAGVTGAKLHRFRDTFITDKIQDGVDLNTVRVWIGHKNFDTLKLYAQALRNKDQRAREAANRQDRYTLTAVAAD